MKCWAPAASSSWFCFRVINVPLNSARPWAPVSLAFNAISQARGGLCFLPPPLQEAEGAGALLQPLTLLGTRTLRGPPAPAYLSMPLSPRQQHTVPDPAAPLSSPLSQPELPARLNWTHSPCAPRRLHPRVP